MNDDFESRVHDRLQARSRPDEESLETLASFIDDLPPRRRRVRAGRPAGSRAGLLRAAAVVVLAVVVAIGLVNRAPGAGVLPSSGSASGGGAPTTAAASGLITFREGGLVFEYPSSWHEFHYTMTSSFSNQIAYLATVDIPEPCATTVTPSFTTIACANRYELTPGSLVVSVSNGGSPGFDMTATRPVGSTSWTVGGLPAYLQIVATPSADLSLQWTISRPGSVDNFYVVQADMRGPGLDQLRGQLEALISSLRYDPPVVPLPVGSAAASAAAKSALAALVKNSPVWACFSLSGSHTMMIDALPNGPPLAKPQLATCTMTIEASPLQLWRMALSIRLAKPDPYVGTGETTVQWINPDGTLGASIGGPLAP